MAAGTTAVESPEDSLLAGKSREQRYRLGQFFTPTAVAEYMAERVMEVDPKNVLDPGVGGGVLLRALPPTIDRFGLDIDPDAVVASRAGLSGGPGAVDIQQGDFLIEPTLEEAGDLPFSTQTFDAVIANPPYVKHHLLDKSLKASMRRRYERELGIRVSSLSSLYIYFFMESILRLNPSGRLVFITPTEFLDSSYGRAVKEALLEHCSIDDILVYAEDALTFGDDVLSTSAITVATKRRPESPVGRTVRMGELLGVDFGDARRAVVENPNVEEPWTSYAPGKVERNAVLHAGRERNLSDFARVRRGIATGSNKFFCLTQAEVDEWSIEEQFLVPCLVGARDLPADGSPISWEHFEALRDEGRRCWLLWCHESKTELAGTCVLEYLTHGESIGVHEAYNCRSRSPWYSVEQVGAPDWFVTYMNRENARFSRNLIGARCLTSLLNVWASEGVDKNWLDAELSSPLIPALLRSVGRNYGGGLGKTEPRELLRLPLPSP